MLNLLVWKYLFVAERVRDGFLNDVQIVFLRKHAIDFGDHFAIDVDDDGIWDFLAFHLKTFADDVMMADLLFRLGEFLRRVKIEENEGPFGDLLEIARVENTFA